eukprot:3141522-Rhodomonas_salina.1
MSDFGARGGRRVLVGRYVSTGRCVGTRYVSTGHPYEAETCDVSPGHCVGKSQAGTSEQR